MKSLGYSFLIDHFDLQVCDLLSKSYLSDASQSRVVESESVVEHYYSSSRIEVGETWQDNLLFALKYEGMNLEVLNAFFAVCDKTALTELIRSVPTGTGHRRLWFVYEWLTDERLEMMRGLTPVVFWWWGLRCLTCGVKSESRRMKSCP